MDWCTNTKYSNVHFKRANAERLRDQYVLWNIDYWDIWTKEFLHVQGDHSIEVKLQNLPSGLFATKLQFTMEYLKSIDHNFQQDLKKELISVYS